MGVGVQPRWTVQHPSFAFTAPIKPSASNAARGHSQEALSKPSKNVPRLSKDCSFVGGHTSILFVICSTSRRSRGGGRANRRGVRRFQNAAQIPELQAIDDPRIREKLATILVEEPQRPSCCKPQADQQQAIDKLLDQLGRSGKVVSLLHGATGTGKTFVLADGIHKLGLPAALVLSPDVELARQLVDELRKHTKNLFQRDLPVHLFKSPLESYTPEFVDKDGNIVKAKAVIDRDSVLEREKVLQLLKKREPMIVVATVSAIFDLSVDAVEFESLKPVVLNVGDVVHEEDLTSRLSRIGYVKTSKPAEVALFSIQDSLCLTVSFADPRKKLTVSLHRHSNRFRIAELVIDDHGILANLPFADLDVISHKLSVQSNLRPAVVQSIIRELRDVKSQYLGQQLQNGNKEEKSLFRTLVNLRRKVLDHCRHIKKGVSFTEQKDYHWHVRLAQAGSSRNSLVNYMNHFYDGQFLTIWDESHVMKKQLAAMSKGDSKRKEIFVKDLVKLPSFANPVPLSLEETLDQSEKLLFMTATPGTFEDGHKTVEAVSMVIRPTFIPDPIVELRHQDMTSLREEVLTTRKAGMQTLVFCVTRGQMKVARGFLGSGIRSEILHCGLTPKERATVISRFRKGKLDVLFSMKLNQVGFDEPHVGLVCVLEADGKGSRSAFSRQTEDLIQMIGRACRNPEGRVLLFAADHSNPKIVRAVEQTRDRRTKQLQYNEENGKVPKAVKRYPDGWWKEPGTEGDDSDIEERHVLSATALVANDGDLESFLNRFGLKRTYLADFYALAHCHEINFKLAKRLLESKNTGGTLKNVLKLARNNQLDVKEIGEKRCQYILNSIPYQDSKDQPSKLTTREKELQEKEWASELDDLKRAFANIDKDADKLYYLRRAEIRTEQ